MKYRISLERQMPMSYNMNSDKITIKL